MASALIIHNANVYNPSPIGINDILSINGLIVHIDKKKIESRPLIDLGIDVVELDVEGYILTPGFLDPHEHIIGGSGEEGFASRSPEIGLNEIVRGGITTVVGCLGVDTYTRNMPSLLAQCKTYNEEGITSYIYTGGYNIPPTTLSGGILEDMVKVAEVIGSGEVAVSDIRSSKASNREVAKLISQTYNGGILTGKAGVSHLHLGDANSHFDPVMQMVVEHDLNIKYIYPTHCGRNQKLLEQATQATKLGMTIDIDVGDDDLVPNLKKFRSLNGDEKYLTLSSDASFCSPSCLYEQIIHAKKELNLNLEELLPFITTNTARILKLPKKGKIEIDADADFNVINPTTFDLRYVIAKGQFFVRDGKPIHKSKSLINSTRVIERYGQKKIPR
jgi:beta-aspartyl-dipeptidase (metallo-type)